MHYGLHQAVQHGVSLGDFTQLVLFLGCEADEVVLTEANLVLGEVEAVYTEIEVKECLVRLGWKSVWESGGRGFVMMGGMACGSTMINIE